MTRVSSKTPLSAAQILALYDAEQRRDVEYFDTRRETSLNTVRHTSRFGGQGAVIYWDLDGANVVAVVLEEIRYFESIGQDFEWKVYEHDSPSELGAQLVGLGFKAEAEETIVFLDLSTLPERLTTSTNTNENVERVFDPDGVDEIMRMMQGSGTRISPTSLRAYEANCRRTRHTLGSMSCAWMRRPQASAGYVSTKVVALRVYGVERHYRSIATVACTVDWWRFARARRSATGRGSSQSTQPQRAALF